MNTSSILEVKNISKVYHTIEGEIEALNNISFNINSGDFIGLIGPSGCGKSSILNIISNLDKNYKGNINIKNGIKVSYMLQEDALFPWLTVFDNALLGLKIKHKLNNIIFFISLPFPDFFWWLSLSPNFLSLNVMKLSPLFSFPFPVWDLTTPPQKNSNLWFLSTIVPDVFPSPDYIPLFA